MSTSIMSVNKYLDSHTPTGTLAELVDFIKTGYSLYNDNSRPSLTSYTKQTNIMSRLYIENTIMRDDIIVPLVGVLNQLYVSYILCALNFDSKCANGRTVREMIETVGTESYDLVKEILTTFGSNNYNYSNEASSGPVVGLEQDTQRLPVGRVIELSLTGVAPLEERKNECDGYELTRSAARRETTFNFKAYLYVQLIPYILQSDVINGYIGANFNPPLSARWKAYRAGEISFWNDFIFTRDLIKKQEAILKKDRAGIISEMMSSQGNKLFRWLTGFIGFNSASHNIANSIMICSKETFNRACAENHIHFNNFSERQRFFTKTWAMIICVVDPMYSTVEMYFNGIDAKGTYTFNIINHVGAKGKDSFDLKEIMSSFSQGLSPKF